MTTVFNGRYLSQLYKLPNDNKAEWRELRLLRNTENRVNNCFQCQAWYTFRSTYISAKHSSFLHTLLTDCLNDVENQSKHISNWQQTIHNVQRLALVIFNLSFIKRFNGQRVWCRQMETVSKTEIEGC